MTTASTLNGSITTPLLSTPLICSMGQPCFEDYLDFTQLIGVRIVFIILYIAIIVVALLGNLLVIWTVKKNPSLHNLTNYYIVNLSVSDILIAVFVVPLRLMEYVAPMEWNIFNSDILCAAVQYIMPVFVFSSVLTLIAVSIERYQAVIDPFSSLHASRTCRRVTIIVTIWLLPIVICVPFVYFKSYSVILHSNLGTIERQLCLDRYNDIDIWLHGPQAHNAGHFRKGFHIILFVTMYIIPLLVICYSSLRIALHLLMFVEKIEIGRRSSWLLFEENKRKVAKMVVVVALFFFVSWTPFYLINLISLFDENVFGSNYVFIMLLTHCIGFTNCCTNPFIYIVMCDKFNESFKEILKRIKHCMFVDPTDRARSSVSTVCAESGGKPAFEMNSLTGKSKKPKSARLHKNDRVASQLSADDSDLSSNGLRTRSNTEVDQGSWSRENEKRKYSTTTVIRDSCSSEKSDAATVEPPRSRRVSIVTEKLEQEFFNCDTPGLIMVPNLRQKSVKKLLRKISVGVPAQGIPGTPNMDKEELDQWKGSLHCLLDIQLADGSSEDDDVRTVKKNQSSSKAPNLSSKCFEESRNKSDGSFDVDVSNEARVIKTDTNALIEQDVNDKTRILDDIDGQHVNSVHGSICEDGMSTSAKSDTVSVADVEVCILNMKDITDKVAGHIDDIKEIVDNNVAAAEVTPSTTPYAVPQSKESVNVSTKKNHSTISSSSKIDACCQTNVGLLQKSDIPAGTLPSIHDFFSRYDEAFIAALRDFSLKYNDMSSGIPKETVSLDNNSNVCSVKERGRTSEKTLRTEEKSKNKPDVCSTSHARNRESLNQTGQFRNCQQRSPTPLRHKGYTRVSKHGASMTTLDSMHLLQLQCRIPSSPPVKSRKKRSLTSPNRPRTTSPNRQYTRSPPISPRSMCSSPTSQMTNSLNSGGNYHTGNFSYPKDRQQVSPPTSPSYMGRPARSRSPQMHYKLHNSSPKRKIHGRARMSEISHENIENKNLPLPSVDVLRFSPEQRTSLARVENKDITSTGFVTDSDTELAYTLKMKDSKSSYRQISRRKPFLTDVGDDDFCDHHSCEDDGPVTQYGNEQHFDNERSIFSASRYVAFSDVPDTMEHEQMEERGRVEHTMDSDLAMAKSSLNHCRLSMQVNGDHSSTVQSLNELRTTTSHSETDVHESKNDLPTIRNQNAVLSDSSPKRRRSGVVALNEHNVPLKSANPNIVYLDILSRTMQQGVTDNPKLSTQYTTGSLSGYLPDLEMRKKHQSCPNTNNDQSKRVWTGLGDNYVTNKFKTLHPTILEETDEENEHDLAVGEELPENGTVSCETSYASVENKHSIGEIRKLSIDSEVSFLSAQLEQSFGNVKSSRSQSRKITPVLQATANKLKKLVNSHSLNGSTEQLSHRHRKCEDPVHV